MKKPFIALLTVAGLAALARGSGFGEKADPTTPGARLGHASVYDAQRGQVLLFGGFRPDGEPLGDTWSWDGERWARLATTGPAPRKWAAIAFDERRGKVLLFGGLGGIGRSQAPFGDTWQWDGRVWRQLDLTQGPSPRDHVQMTYDPERGRIVLFGGWDGAEVRNDTWIWNGEGWRQAAPEADPPARAAHAMAFDHGRGTVVLFGGRASERFFDDTWTWDGAGWTRQEPSDPGPTPRAFHAMTSGGDHEPVILFGGWHEHDDAPRVLFGDTWGWDGSAWKRLSASGPSARGAYSMAFDRERGEAVLHGGGFNRGDGWMLMEETWRWRRRSWHSP